MAGDSRAALTRALTRAEAALQLSAGVAHDVRNALQVVLGCSDLLCHDGLSPEQAESARDIHQAATHAMAVLHDFIAIGRPSTSTIEVVDPAGLLRQLRPMMLRVTQSRVTCDIDVDPDVWPVSVERQQLEAVLLNFCANARDAMPQGGRIDLSVRNVTAAALSAADPATGDHVAFSVRDTGSGMSPAVLDRATDAFFTTKAGGTGLGLAMAQEFATRSGGALGIQSTIGLGTTVELRLPRSTPQAENDTALVRRRQDVVQAMRQQIRTPWLRDALDAWHGACSGAALPSPLDVEVAIAPQAGMSIAVLIDDGASPGRLRLLRLGGALRDALATASRGEGDLVGALAASLGDVYRRAAASGTPGYERVRYSFGHAPPAEFERLVMPASADGQRVSHLVGVLTFSGTRHP